MKNVGVFLVLSLLSLSVVFGESLRSSLPYQTLGWSRASGAVGLPIGVNAPDDANVFNLILAPVDHVLTGVAFQPLFDMLWITYQNDAGDDFELAAFPLGQETNYNYAELAFSSPVSAEHIAPASKGAYLRQDGAAGISFAVNRQSTGEGSPYDNPIGLIPGTPADDPFGPLIAVTADNVDYLIWIDNSCEPEAVIRTQAVDTSNPAALSVVGATAETAIANACALGWDDTAKHLWAAVDTAPGTQMSVVEFTETNLGDGTYGGQSTVALIAATAPVALLIVEDNDEFYVAAAPAPAEAGVTHKIYVGETDETEQALGQSAAVGSEATAVRSLFVIGEPFLPERTWLDEYGDLILFVAMPIVGVCCIGATCLAFGAPVGASKKYKINHRPPKQGASAKRGPPPQQHRPPPQQAPSRVTFMSGSDGVTAYSDAGYSTGDSGFSSEFTTGGTYSTGDTGYSDSTGWTTGTSGSSGFTTGSSGWTTGSSGTSGFTTGSSGWTTGSSGFTTGSSGTGFTTGSSGWTTGTGSTGLASGWTDETGGGSGGGSSRRSGGSKRGGGGSRRSGGSKRGQSGPVSSPMGEGVSSGASVSTGARSGYDGATFAMSESNASGMTSMYTGDTRPMTGTTKPSSGGGSSSAEALGTYQTPGARSSRGSRGSRGSGGSKRSRGSRRKSGGSKRKSSGGSKRKHH